MPCAFSPRRRPQLEKPSRSSIIHPAASSYVTQCQALQACVMVSLQKVYGKRFSQPVIECSSPAQSSTQGPKQKHGTWPDVTAHGWNTPETWQVDDRESPGHDRDFLGENFPRCMRGAQLPYSCKDPKLIIVNEKKCEGTHTHSAKALILMHFHTRFQPSQLVQISTKPSPIRICSQGTPREDRAPWSRRWRAPQAKSNLVLLCHGRCWKVHKTRT